MSSLIIPFPTELRPRLPTILGNVDYLTLRSRLEQIDQLLQCSGLERDFVERALKRWLGEGTGTASAGQQQKFQVRSRRALRCTILRTLLQEDYQGFSCALAANPLYQWFCLVDGLEVVRVPSKSELQRFTQWLPAAEMRALIDGLSLSGLKQSRKLQLKAPLDLESYFLDTTCLKANIHFPTDWVLLRDGVRTLMKATELIRKNGLKSRMRPPAEFLRRMNRLSIEMTQRRRGRKATLRRMKKRLRIVRAHARRHRELLDKNWEKTPWTRPQVEQVLGRIDGVLDLLPKAQKQAHERIIGGRLVANSQKILSLYEPDVRVIVRGKADAEVEFGNTVLVAENAQGIILDYQVWREPAPADVNLPLESLERLKEVLGCTVGAVVTDRGFASAANTWGLKSCGIYDGTCPRQPARLKARMRSGCFAQLQRRRGQTEGRISILKRGFLGTPMRAKGFEHRELALAWGVLAHNLWMFARMVKKKKKRKTPDPLRQAA
jgi:hypothetical protein